MVEVKRTLFVLSVAVSVLICSARGQQPAGGGEGDDGGGERRKIDFRADEMRSVPGQPDSVMRLLGNVVMHHNGAVLTCDSAYRFGDKRLEFYGRVLLNQDSAYIYGDRALYDGYLNVAEVYSPLVKVIDGEATLYTRNFSFNTLENVGRFWGGGTVVQKDNRLESDRGYYYSDTHEFVCVDEVEATDPQYKMMSDSVRYNMDTETAYFYTPTTIWNDKGEILNATVGMYRNAEEHYEFSRDGYVLTATRELWSDSLDYRAATEDVVLRRNIQIRDEEQKVMAFGDFGRYWGGREEGLLTENPSLVTFDPKEDSLYMRSDSIWIYSIAYELDYKEYDSLRRVPQELLTVEEEQAMIDSENVPADSLAVDPGLVVPRDTAELSDDVWPAVDNPAMRESLRWQTVADRLPLYMRGDTISREGMRPGLVDTLMMMGYASEDIQGQLLYNERKRELEAQGLPVTDTLLYEVLESIGAFGNPVPPDPHEAALEALREIEQAEKEAEGHEIETEQELSEAEQAQAEEQKPLTRRQQRRMERERKAVERKERRAQRTNRDETRNEDAVTTGGIGDMLSEADVTLTGEALENLMKLAADPELESMVRKLAADSTFRRRGLEAIPDSLLGRLWEAGVDPQALGEQLAAAGLISPGDIVLPTDSLAVDSLAMPAAPTIVHDSLQRVILAYHNVRIFRNDMQAVCDSLVAFSKDSTAHLYIEPVMWNQQNQITSEVIDIFTQNEQLHRAFFNGWPMMISEVDSTQYNQIKGREMESFFRDNQIFRHSVKGNAQTLYYMIDEPSGEANGFLVVNSASITFLMEDQTIVRMTWYQDPDAVAYPIDKIPFDVDRFLEGFRWEADRRPSLRDVFDRTIKPSEREHYQSLPQPLFPITIQIDEEKRQLIESRQWEDRAETLEDITNSAAKEWLRSIGFDVTGR